MIQDRGIQGAECCAEDNGDVRGERTEERGESREERGERREQRGERREGRGEKDRAKATHRGPPPPGSGPRP